MPQDTENKLEHTTQPLENSKVKAPHNNNSMIKAWTDTQQHNIHNNKANKQAPTLTETCIYMVELPISEHWRPEVKGAKKVEINNLQGYETFIEMKDEGQTWVGSGWITTKKEQHYGQKTNIKAWLVARGFQETLNHSQTVLCLQKNPLNFSWHLQQTLTPA